MPTDNDVLDLFKNIRCWNSGGVHAPNKPLLLLMNLAQIQRGEGQYLQFAENEEKLVSLLRDFGPSRKNFHPEYPFWRLRNDGVWEIQNEEELQSCENSKGDVPITQLRGKSVRGGIKRSIFDHLKNNPNLVNNIVAVLLNQGFSTTMHDEILDAVGFPWGVSAKRKRDPKFREEILRIYDRRCAICGYDGRLGHADLGIEAAHIKWHAAGGPDSQENGMALCSFHHVAFDKGAIGISENMKIMVSQDVSGQSRVDELILRFSGKELRRPQIGCLGPAKKFTDWHRKQRFRAPPRGVAT